MSDKCFVSDLNIVIHHTHVISISGKIHLRNRKHVPCFYRVIETETGRAAGSVCDVVLFLRIFVNMASLYY